MTSWLVRLLLMLILPLLPMGLAACGGGGGDDDDEAAPAAEEAVGEEEGSGDGAEGADASAASMTGNWVGEFGTGAAFSMTLTQTGDGLTGNYKTGSFDGSVSGSVSGNDVDMTVSIPGGATSVFTGTVNEQRTSMVGEFTIVAGGGGSGTWSATK